MSVLGGKQTFPRVARSDKLTTVVVFRALLISILAGWAGAFGGELLLGGSVLHLGPTMFASYFTVMVTLGILTPVYAVMKFADVSISRRYIAVFLLGTLTGIVIVLPLDLVTGDFDGARLGGCFGAITASFWILLHALLRAMKRERPVA